MSEETRMGYQPALDGLRALSVIAVILYHAGIHWIPGGFIGVEVFFVVSGFLITSLMIDEQHSNGKVDLKQFWIRRFRRPERDNFRSPMRRDQSSCSVPNRMGENGFRDSIRCSHRTAGRRQFFQP